MKEFDNFTEEKRKNSPQEFNDEEEENLKFNQENVVTKLSELLKVK